MNRSERLVATRPTRTYPTELRRSGGDLGDGESLIRAMTGVTGVFSVIRPGPLDNLASAALTAGVSRVVLLTSAMAQPDGPDNPLASALRQAEASLVEAGVASTFLRPTAFTWNTLDWAGSIRAEDLVRALFGGLRLAAIDPRDVAAVASTALTQEGHTDNAYLLTGPAVLSIAEQVETIAEALGRPIAFAELSEAEARAHLLEGSVHRLTRS